MVSIDIPKIIFIYGIILVLMYVFIIQGNVVPNVSKFTDKSESTYIAEKVLETDYDSEKTAKVYLQYFLENMSKMNESTFSKFFDATYYKAYSSKVKGALIEKARIRDSKNTSYIELVSKEKNKDGQNVFTFNVIVMRKNYTYPEGYKILSEENSIDKNKNIDIIVIEKLPYEYELQIPDKEFVG